MFLNLLLVSTFSIHLDDPYSLQIILKITSRWTNIHIPKVLYWNQPTIKFKKILETPSKLTLTFVIYPNNVWIVQMYTESWNKQKIQKHFYNCIIWSLDISIVKTITIVQPIRFQYKTLGMWILVHLDVIFKIICKE
jgi:hypothetical protein